MKIIKSTLLALALILAAAPGLFAAEGAEDFRQVVKEKGDAVIRLEIVVEMKAAMFGQQSENEQKFESVGTVLDEKGLAVTSLSNLDPAALYASYFGEDAEYSARLKKILYIMPNGDEIEAGVVIRDPDLDLVFLKPTEEVEDSFVHLSLDEQASPGMLDPIFAISRLGRIARRTVGAMSGEVQAIIERPRKLYITDGEISSAGAGSPVLTSTGAFVGMNGYHSSPGGRAARSQNEQPYMFVVIPAESLKPVADQATDLEPREAGQGQTSNNQDEEEADESTETEE